MSKPIWVRKRKRKSREKLRIELTLKLFSGIGKLGGTLDELGCICDVCAFIICGNMFIGKPGGGKR